MKLLELKWVTEKKYFKPSQFVYRELIILCSIPRILGVRCHWADGALILSHAFQKPLSPGWCSRDPGQLIIFRSGHLVCRVPPLEVVCLSFPVAKRLFFSCISALAGFKDPQNEQTPSGPLETYFSQLHNSHSPAFCFLDPCTLLSEGQN